MFDKLVIFEIDGQSYAFDSLAVVSIEKDVNLMPLYGAPEIVIGAVNFRNEITPFIDMAKKFGRTGKNAEAQNIFVRAVGGCMGFKVDSVQEICNVGPDSQMDLPIIVAAPNTEYVAAIINHNGLLVTVINPNKLLSADEKKQLEDCLHVVRDKKKKEEEAAAEAARKAAEEAKKAAEAAKAQQN